MASQQKLDEWYWRGRKDRLERSGRQLGSGVGADVLIGILTAGILPLDDPEYDAVAAAYTAGYESVDDEEVSTYRAARERADREDEPTRREVEDLAERHLTGATSDDLCADTSDMETPVSDGSFSAAGCLGIFGGVCLLAGILASVGHDPQAGSMLVVGVLVLAGAGVVHYISENVLARFPIIGRAAAAGFFGYMVVGMGGCLVRTFPDPAAAGGLAGGLRSFTSEAIIGAILAGCIAIASTGKVGLIVAAGILIVSAFAGLAVTVRNAGSSWGSAFFLHAGNERISDTAEERTVELPANFQRDFTGSLDGRIAIRMSLKRSGSSIRGTVVYVRYGKPISVRGAFTGDTSFALDEFDEKERLVGRYTGQFVSETIIRGTWSKPNGADSRTLELTAPGR